MPSAVALSEFKKNKVFTEFTNNMMHFKIISLNTRNCCCLIYTRLETRKLVTLVKLKRPKFYLNFKKKLTQQFLTINPSINPYFFAAPLLL